MLEISVTSYKYRNAKTKPCMKDTLNNANRTYAETYLTVDVVYRERKWFVFDLYNLSVVETGDANI